MRQVIAESNKRLLRDDLEKGRTEFRSWPVEAHVQMSTYCDASCVMCWDGHNPPTIDVSDDALAGVAALAERGLRLIVPHDGSEPLARRWSRTHAFAREHHLVLEVTTNGRSLTPRKLNAALDVLDHLVVSIDSHDPDTFERIRPGIRAPDVFANTIAAVDACTAAGVPISANIVLMSENVDSVHDTVHWLAEIGIPSVTIVRMKSVNGRSAVHDPMLTHGAATVALAEKRCREVAERARIELWWCHDEEPPVVEPIETSTSVREQVHNLYAELTMAHPGFCRFAHSGLRVRADGATTPCGYAARGELDLGNLALDGPDDVWNGPTARDLRRAMYTRDLPALCATCIHAQDPMPTATHAILDMVPSAELPWPVRVDAPRGVIRSEDAPTLHLDDVPVDVQDIALLIEGRPGEPPVVLEVPDNTGAQPFEVTIPRALWRTLDPYAARWFTIVGTRPGRGRARLADEAWALVRSPWMPRIDGSRIRYDHTGTDAEVNLGTAIPVRRSRG